MDLYLSTPGVMSCAGKNIDELWASVISGNQKNIKKVKACNDDEFFAARIADSDLKPSGARFDMKIMRIENAALEQISDDIKAAVEKYGTDRIAVCVGSCDNGTEFSLAGHHKYFDDDAFPAEYSLEIQGADFVATFIAEKFGLKGPVNTFSTACSSSAGAIIKAAEMIMAGLADAAVVGGIDIASDTTLIGFNSLEAVSSEITNPFSKNRHGITLGDGAAFFVLSKEEVETSVASTDSTTIKLLGWGESADAYHMTSPDPSGAGAEKAIRLALENAKISASDVGYINLHGTGTKFNDSMESKAVNAVFGEAGNNVPVSTTKPITGHTLGAAAALELAICWKAIKENAIPVQVWDGQRDEEIPALNFADKKTKPAQKELKVCLSNSFAFGGANACLVIGE
ncbi:MAG: 3-oxoacyl-ACP synthase [Treponema sp.]|nr:3-oxoacyl-ACP synthase [Treponema sp.]